MWPIGLMTTGGQAGAGAGGARGGGGGSGAGPEAEVGTKTGGGGGGGGRLTTGKGAVDKSETGMKLNEWLHTSCHLRAVMTRSSSCCGHHTHHTFHLSHLFLEACQGMLKLLHPHILIELNRGHHTLDRCHKLVWEVLGIQVGVLYGLGHNLL